MTRRPQSVAMATKPMHEHIFVYLCLLLMKVMLFIMLRALGIAIAFTLIVPFIFLISSLGTTQQGPDFFTLLMILFWPYALVSALTGRTSFDENDIELLVIGWTSLAIIVGFIINKLGFRIHMRLRYFLFAILGLNAFAALSVVLNPNQPDKGGLIFGLSIFMVASLLLSVFAYATNFAQKALSKQLQR